MRHILLIFLCLPLLAFANDQELVDKQYNPLFLSCLIESTGYRDMEPGDIPIKLGLLLPYKEERGGHFKLLDTDKYEFWVLSYSYVEVNGVIDIGSFQVAIKDKVADIFVHANSTVDYTKPEDTDYRPKYARVSLVDYEQGSFTEKGELSLMCNQIAESPLESTTVEIN